MSVKLEIANAEYCADKLKALSDPIRLRVIETLRAGEMTVGVLAERLGVEVVTVSHHLQILKHAQLVETRRDGRRIHYRLSQGLLQKGQAKTNDHLDLGCCRIELSAPLTKGK